jgi:hypothetical protein
VAARDLLERLTAPVRNRVSGVVAAARRLRWAAANPGKWRSLLGGTYRLSREMFGGGVIVPETAARHGGRGRRDGDGPAPDAAEPVHLSSLLQADGDMVLVVSPALLALDEELRREVLDRHFKEVEDTLRPLHDLGALGTLVIAAFDLAGGVFFVEGLARGAATGTGWRDMLLGPALILGGRGARWLSTRTFDWVLVRRMRAALSRL